MKPIQFFIPVLALVGTAVVAPAWFHWLGQYDSFPAHLQFLGGLVMPTLLLLLGASWLEPR